MGTNGRVWEFLIFPLEKGSCLRHLWILGSGTWARAPKFGPSNPRMPSSATLPQYLAPHIFEYIFYASAMEEYPTASLSFIQTRTEMYKSLREIQIPCVDKIVTRSRTITSKPAGENWADLVHCVKGWSPSSLTRENIFLYGYQNPGETTHAENQAAIRVAMMSYC